MNDEAMLVGCVMRSADALADARELVDVTDLDDPSLAAIAVAVVSLDRAGIHNDPQAVAGRLADLGTLDRVGGPAAVADVWQAAPPPGSASYYARRVALANERRNLRLALLRGVQACDDADTEEPGALHAAVLASLESVDASRAEPGISVADYFETWYENLGHGTRHLPTPWEGINRLLVGYSPGRFYVVGARPGQGKSIVGFQTAAHLTTHGRVLYSSNEMGRDELMKRLVAMRATVPLDRLERDTLTPADREAVARITPEVFDRMRNLTILDEGNATVEQTIYAARRMKRRGGLSALVVDYLQLLTAEGRFPSRYEALAHITRTLKLASRELDVPVIALAQLNREGEKGGTRRAPTPADLRDSGTIEQDADVILLLQRGYDETAEEFTDDIALYVAKNRQGRLGKVPAEFEGRFARISDAAGWSAAPAPADTPRPYKD